MNVDSAEVSTLTTSLNHCYILRRLFSVMLESFLSVTILQIVLVDLSLLGAKKINSVGNSGKRETLRSCI